MKFFNKQTLAFAIVGALASGSAMSADLIQTSNTIYAKEIKMPAVGLSLDVHWKVGYNFNTNETRYACIRLEGAEPTGVAPDITEADGTTAAGAQLTAGTVNTNGNVAFFTLSSDPTNPAPAGGTKDFQVQLNGLTVDIADRNTTVKATVGLYDNPAAAGQCLAAGSGNPQLIAGTGDTKDLITFKPSFEFVTDPSKATASVDNTLTPFAGFKNVAGVTANGNAAGTNADDANLATAQVNLLTYGTPATAPLDINGNPVTLADLFDTAVATNSVLTIGGDFGAWMSTKQFDAANPTTATATAANWQVDPTALDGDFEITVDPASDNEIPVGNYVATLKVKAKAPFTLDYNDAHAGQSVTLSPTFSDIDNTDSAIDAAYAEASAGQIDQDGTRLQAPLVQVPGGWLSRLVITNTSKKDRKFFLKVYSEDGNTVTTGQLDGYVVKAESTYVIESLGDTVLQGFTPGKNKRGTIVAVVAGPQKEIKGLYQIVNPEGALSNYVMVNQDNGGH